MSVYRFVGLVVVLLLPCFALWYALGNLTPAPGLWLGQAILTWGLPELVDEVTFSGHELLVMSQFAEANGQVAPLTSGGYQLGFPVNSRTLSYSIPFYTALHFATRMPESSSRYVFALVVLWLFIGLGVVAITLKNLMLTLGDKLFLYGGSFVPPSEVIALSFQFSTLIVPTVVPILLWAWASRDSGLWDTLLRS